MVRIAIDMDEVIADFTAKLLRLYNEKYEASYTKADLEGINLRDVRPEHAEAIRAMIREEDYFSDLPVIEGAQEALKKLSEKHELFITTAAMDFPTSFNAKYEWLQEHFPFIPDTHYVFCGDKSIISADYLIDDHSRHLKSFKGQGILFAAHHNANESYELKMDNWAEISNYFENKY
ncbi:5'-3'-deoxyribonucleotidase [Enterococcus raffinosus]|uniref:5' nucleotidase, NT5C type n=1 Tax=Enterococcus raffinosus TaxID=71452 RepID=UPI001C0FDF6D|nr:5'-3'-deoxyribonucleotidase [Enterococcus raffinosus]MBU5361505.1 5'-3'-deoxyribonucleotidase [Enterococcus raffinosus]